MPQVLDADHTPVWYGEKSWRRISPKRPFVYAADGYAAPTPLEIEEGKAHKRWKAKPEDAERGEAWKALHIRLYQEEGMPCTSRCAWCHVVRWGRPIDALCGHCGKKKEIGDEPA